MLFYDINFVRNYDKLRVHAFAKQKYFVNKNKTEPNPSHSFIETNLVLQLILESQSKINTVMSWSSRKKKKGIFCTVYFVRRNFLKIFVLSQRIVY